MSGNVRSSSRMTGCTGSHFGHKPFGITGSGMRSKSQLTRLTHFYHTTRPQTSGFYGFTRAVVFRMILLKKQKHMLSAVSSPDSQ
jgi:hypothetical protein